jgi:hypothetical protein
MNGRVYDPTIGRFISVDPLISNLNDSQSVNPYAYVGNRPLNHTDPTGLNTCVVWFNSIVEGNSARDFAGEFITIEGTPLPNYACFTEPSFDQSIPIPPGGLLYLPTTLPPPLVGSPQQGPQGNQSQQQQKCPKGQWADLANGIVDLGKNLSTQGTTVTKAGATLALGGAITSIVAPEVGLPTAALGVAIAGGGVLTNVVGVATQGFGGAILSFMGNPQPLRGAAVQGGQIGFEKAIKMPDLPLGVPDPFDKVTEAISGVNPCP